MHLTNHTAKAHELRKYAWDYFQLHAAQRMTVFNFFIVVATVVTTGLFTTLHERTHLQGILLGILLAFISFVFWKLDTRTQFLIRNSENVLKELEESFGALGIRSEPHMLQLFRWEETETAHARKNNGVCVWRNHLTYGQCLKYIFWCFIIVGLLGSSISVVRLTEWCGALGLCDTPRTTVTSTSVTGPGRRLWSSSPLAEILPVTAQGHFDEVGIPTPGRPATVDDTTSGSLGRRAKTTPAPAILLPPETADSRKTAATERRRHATGTQPHPRPDRCLPRHVLHG